MDVSLHCLITVEAPLCRSILSSLLHDCSRNVQWTVNRDRCRCSVDSDVSDQCGIAASKGNQVLGLIRRTITFKEKQLIVPLYKAIVIPHLEYCIQAWRPYRKKDIDKLERIQRRANKMIPELRDFSYDSRLL